MSKTPPPDWNDPEQVKAYKRARYYATLDKARARYKRDKKKMIAYSQAWKAARPGYARERFLVNTYGITTAQYDAMLRKQRNQCAICRTVTPKGLRGVFHVDHCHKTGRLRGLLCDRCNRVFLPLVEKRLPSILKYLRIDARANQ